VAASAADGRTPWAGWLLGLRRTTGSSTPRQPACVLAFFLRLASLRFRFTLGFS
jgi:hypothetical protein